MSRIRRALAGDPERGLTLVELVMSMALTALALTLVGTFFMNITRGVTDGRSERDATGAASNAIDEIGRVIRSAAPIATASGTPLPAVAVGSGATSITVLSWADVNPQNPVPSQVVFTVNGAGAVLETRTAGVLVSGYWSFTGLKTTRTYTGPLVLAFTYWNDDVDPSTQVLPTTVSTASSVTSVKVTVTAAKAAWRSNSSVVLTTTALMPNATLN